MTEKEHATGTLKNYCFPFCRPQCVTMSELNSLPFKYLVVGAGQSTGVDTTGQSHVCAKVNGSVLQINVEELNHTFSPTPTNHSLNGSLTDSTRDGTGSDTSSKASSKESTMAMNLKGHIVSYVNSKPLPPKSVSPLEQPLLGDCCCSGDLQDLVRSKRRDKNAREVGETNVNSHPITVYTNVRLTRNMQHLLYRLHKQGELGAEAWKREAATEGALKMVDELRAEFRNCERLAPLNANGDKLEEKVSALKGDLKLNPKILTTCTNGAHNEQIVGA